MALCLTGCSLVLDGNRYLDGSSPADAGREVDGGRPIDAGFDAGTLRDSGPERDGGADAAVDAGPDVDGGPDAGSDAGLPPPGAPHAWTLDPGIRLRDATRVGDDILVVGTTDPLPGLGREGMVIRFTADGSIRWAERIGAIRGEQLSGIAQSGDTTLLGGVTRSFEGSGPVRDQVLLMEATDEGVGRAWQWGSATDGEFLWSLIPGGGLGAWVGLGFHQAGSDRNGLAVVFDDALAPVWAASFDTGSEEEFFSGVVVGTTLYAAGTTGESAEDNTQALVATITASGVTWARRSVAMRARAVHTTVAPSGEVVVAGSVGAGRAALMRFSPEGVVSGTEYGALGSRLTRVVFDGPRTVLVGAQFDVSNFQIRLGRADVSIPARATAADIWTSGFLPTPAVLLDDGYHLVAERTTGFIDLPFSAAPEADCTSEGSTPGTLPLAETAFEDVSLTRTELVFTGGEVVIGETGLTSTDVSPTAVASVCE